MNFVIWLPFFVTAYYHWALLKTKLKSCTGWWNYRYLLAIMFWFDYILIHFVRISNTQWFRSYVTL